MMADETPKPLPIKNRVYAQPFVVAAALIVRDGKVLLVQEKMKIELMDDGKWNHPAGWIDQGENPVDAVVRETKEETGLDFRPTALLGVYSLWRRYQQNSLGAMPHAMKFIFIGEITGGTEKEGVDAGEISDVKWFTPEEIEAMDAKTLRDADIKQAVKDYFAGKQYPLDMFHHSISA